jgi:hypothetical protein
MNHKSIRKIAQRYGPPRRTRQEAFRNTPLPLEALKLNEDIQAIKNAREALRQVDAWNISDTYTPAQRRFAYGMLRSTLALLHTWERYAQQKLRREYLAV